MTVKVIPACPVCGEHMKVSGTLRPGHSKPKKIFSCLGEECSNHKSYLRDGTEIHR